MGVRTGAVSIVCLGLMVLTTPALAEVRLSFADAVKIGVERNLDLVIERFETRISDADVTKNGALYDPHLVGTTSVASERTPNPVTGAGSESFRFTLSPGARQLLPTGGTVGISFENLYSDAGTPGSVSYWGSDLLVTLNQPLLKNFGRETTELSLNLSRETRRAVGEKFTSRLLDLVAQIRSQYFLLHSLREEMKAKETSLQLAKKILVDTKARVDAGVLPAMEILNAEFGVSSRERELIEAERQVRDQEDALRLLIRLDEPGEIVPLDRPVTDEVMLEGEGELLRLVRERSEVKELDASIRALELQMRVAELQTKPELSLNAQAAFAGAGRGYGRDLDRLGSLEYPRWSIGLSFDYPLGNVSAEQEKVKSALKVEQAEKRKENLVSQLLNDLSTKARAVKTAWKQIDVARRGLSYAEERLNAFTKKHEVGLATTKDLLDVENDRAQARSVLIRAEVGYATALTQYWRSTGLLLERLGVTVAGR
ncbi:MAG: TolC family protein [Desulfuromonadia bacterium]